MIKIMCSSDFHRMFVEYLTVYSVSPANIGSVRLYMGSVLGAEWDVADITSKNGDTPNING